jgi:hypothetical protein
MIESLIEKLEAITENGDENGNYAQGVMDCIKIIRQHESARAPIAGKCEIPDIVYWNPNGEVVNIYVSMDEQKIPKGSVIIGGAYFMAKYKDKVTQLQSPEMIEAVARKLQAICYKLEKIEKIHTWETATENNKNSWREKAQAALSTIAERLK